MYLVSVLADLQKVLADFKREAPLLSDHVFKLNEALFNLPEEDEVDAKLAAEVIECAGKIRQAFNMRTYHDKDPSFVYDYLALLGTMQNQPFFEPKQTDILILWIKEVVDHFGGGSANRSKKAEKEQKAPAHQAEQGKGKGKSGKGYAVEEPSKAKGGGKGTKGKAKAAANDFDSESDEPPKGKSKGKSKSKDKSYDEEPAKKGGNAKSKGKGSGKVPDYEIYSTSKSQGNDWDSWWYQSYDDSSSKAAASTSTKGKGGKSGGGGGKGKGKGGKGK